MAELPTKKLLLTMVLGNSSKSMQHELLEHFKLFRNQKFIVDALHSILKSDLEFGIIQEDTISKARVIEAGLKRLVITQMKKSMSNLNSMLESRIRSAPEGVTEDDILQLELDKSNNLVTRYENQTKDALFTINRQHEKFRKILLSFLASPNFAMQAHPFLDVLFSTYNISLQIFSYWPSMQIGGKLWI